MAVARAEEARCLDPFINPGNILGASPAPSFSSRLHVPLLFKCNWDRLFPRVSPLGFGLGFNWKSSTYLSLITVEAVFTNNNNIHCSIVTLVIMYNKTDKYNDYMNLYKNFRILT